MKFCPNCGSPQDAQKGTQSATLGMQDSVISGDVNIVQNSLGMTKEEEIENLAKVMIDKLSRGDMKSARKCWDQAKMVDILLTEKTFNKKYSKEIVNGYLSIAESALDDFSKLFYTDPPYWDLGFQARVRMAPEDVVIPLENSTAFGASEKSFKYNIIYARLHLYRSWFTGGSCATTWELGECNKQYEKYLKEAKKSVRPPEMKKLESLEKEHSKLQERKRQHEHEDSMAFLFMIGCFIFAFIVIASM
tara:strand:- start:243 stop:986 length:744 start_codon:yes stop_codon:yes gene_type:complete